jgi:hypothetical protein
VDEPEPTKRCGGTHLFVGKKQIGSTYPCPECQQEIFVNDMGVLNTHSRPIVRQT